jgi:hypothetical protein
MGGGTSVSVTAEVAKAVPVFLTEMRQGWRRLLK